MLGTVLCGKPQVWGQGARPERRLPLTRHAPDVRGEPGAKPFTDHLLLGRHLAHSRAAPSLRSTESQPSTQGFVFSGAFPPRPPSSPHHGEEWRGERGTVMRGRHLSTPRTLPNRALCPRRDHPCRLLKQGACGRGRQGPWPLSQRVR